MSASLYIGIRLALRRWYLGVIVALVVAAPLVVVVLGVTVDHSSRPSPELQRLAAVGHGAGVLSSASPSGSSNAAVAAVQQAVPGVFLERDLWFDVPAVVAGSSTALNVDKRDWSAAIFSPILQETRDRQPLAPDHVAITSALASHRGVGIGDKLDIAGTTVEVSGVVDLPFALGAEIVLAPQDSAVAPQAAGITVRFRSLISQRELSAAELSELDPELWQYRSASDLAVQRSAFVKQPAAYAVAVFVALFGTVCGAWVVTQQQRRRSASALVRLGARRRVIIASTVVEAGVSVLAGILVSVVILAVWAPPLHRAAAAASRIVAEPGWFPLSLAGGIAAFSGLTVMISAGLFGLAATGDRRTRPAREGSRRRRTLVQRARRASPMRFWSIFAMVFGAVVVATGTATLWSTSVLISRLADPGTRRPGDVEVVLPAGQAVPGLNDALVRGLGGPLSIVRIARPGTTAGGHDNALLGAVGSSGDRFLNVAAPIQVVDTPTDWELLTGSAPSTQQWQQIHDGEMAVLMPELHAAQAISLTSLSDDDDGQPAIIAEEVPHFASDVDPITLNRAKAVVSQRFLVTHGLREITQSVLVRTTLPSDEAERSAGEILTRFGIPGTEIRVGRTADPSPPLTIIALTIAPALLAIQTTVFAAAASAIDERPTRRVLNALGARFRTRYSFAMGCAGSVTVTCAVLGAGAGVAFGVAIATALGWSPAIVIPWPGVLGLTAALVLTSIAANAVAAAKTLGAR